MGISMDHVQNMNGDSAGAKEWRGAMASKQGAAANHVQVSCLHGWTRDSHIGPGWRETLTAKEGNGWREDPRQWATGQAAQLTGVETCNAGARCQTWRRMLLGAINLYSQASTERDW
ncbi:hypothetical protein M441DRAFT_45506 [Trichoderma asperellum CBS 433.97]|uniref:Uncharacterized protein n=1 Tax=Trichoderma asperellum (strain ATCC 204424 / CBS 433.97 / NBRC 101777) TaxID=1042311 RepID=A0A2T3ZFI0_TRIA4|nr:hypothetical protein M441DRAFT_45506 [Trichoderma asperellum CBS 433.97]PTB43568.1 hypothetical protein M441DRAFT_45506 [Trichoderma asperellum CBS 433.97]